MAAGLTAVARGVSLRRLARGAKLSVADRVEAPSSTESALWATEEVERK